MSAFLRNPEAMGRRRRGGRLRRHFHLRSPSIFSHDLQLGFTTDSTPSLHDGHELEQVRGKERRQGGGFWIKKKNTSTVEGKWG